MLISLGPTGTNNNSTASLIVITKSIFNDVVTLKMASFLDVRFFHHRSISPIYRLFSYFGLLIWPFFIQIMLSCASSS